MNSRNTNQKKIILDTLSNMRTHPTIYELHDKIKENDENIGVATVYRNIKKFVNDGIVHIVKTQNGIDRYDYYGNHAHFECLNCGNIIDLFNDSLSEDVKKSAIKNKLKVANCNIMINGYCENCHNDIKKK